MTSITRPQPAVAIVRKLAVPLFLVCGAAGGIHGLTWVRLLERMFGDSVPAADIVLTAFMLGLALGSWLLGRLADRSRGPLRFFAWLEVAVGAYAFALPILLKYADQFHLWFSHAYPPESPLLSLVRFGVLTAVLALPAALMGGTLPVLSTLWAIPAVYGESQTGTGRSVGLLYAAGAFGAAVGSFLAGYVLIRLLGVDRCLYIAAATNVVAGAVALILSWTLRDRRVVRNASKRRQLTRRTILAEIEQADGPAFVYSAGRRTAVLLSVFVAGFCALALHSLWTRMLVSISETSADAFTCMLPCFVFALAVGSLVAGTLLAPRVRNPVFVLGIVMFLLALAVAGLIPLFGSLKGMNLLVTERLAGSRLPFPTDTTAHFIDAVALTFVPTLLMGMAFPLAVKACTPVWHIAGERVGQVFASGAAGCGLNALAAILVTIPRLTTRNDFLVVVGALFLSAVVLILLAGKRRALWALPAAAISGGLIAAAILFVPQDVFM